MTNSTFKKTNKQHDQHEKQEKSFIGKLFCAESLYSMSLTSTELASTIKLIKCGKVHNPDYIIPDVLYSEALQPQMPHMA